MKFWKIILALIIISSNSISAKGKGKDKSILIKKNKIQQLYMGKNLPPRANRETRPKGLDEITLLKTINDKKISTTEAKFNRCFTGNKLKKSSTCHKATLLKTTATIASGMHGSARDINSLEFSDTLNAICSRCQKRSGSAKVCPMNNKKIKKCPSCTDVHREVHAYNALQQHLPKIGGSSRPVPVRCQAHVLRPFKKSNADYPESKNS